MQFDRCPASNDNRREGLGPDPSEVERSGARDGRGLRTQCPAVDLPSRTHQPSRPAAEHKQHAYKARSAPYQRASLLIASSHSPLQHQPHQPPTYSHALRYHTQAPTSPPLPRPRVPISHAPITMHATQLDSSLSHLPSYALLHLGLPSASPSQPAHITKVHLWMGLLELLERLLFLALV